MVKTRPIILDSEDANFVVKDFFYDSLMTPINYSKYIHILKLRMSIHCLEN